MYKFRIYKMPPYLCYRNFTLHSDCLGIVTFPENIQICILGVGGGGGGVEQSRWVFIICRLHLISYLMLLLLLEALEGEREQQRQRQPPTSLLLVPAPKMPEVVPAARISITQLGLGRHSGTGRRCRGWRHRRPSCRRRLQECWRVAADDRKRNLFWSKPQLDRDQDHGVS